MHLVCRDDRQIYELRIKHSIEILSDFLLTTKKSIRTVTLLEYQQYLWSRINKLNEKTKRQQDEELDRAIQVRF